MARAYPRNSSYTASVCAPPRSTSPRLRSMSAVSETSRSLGETTSTSVRPASVECSCLPLRSMYPAWTSFSITSARVAGVPMPPECDSSSSRAAFRSLSSTYRLACSIAASSVASVNGFGGFVLPSETEDSLTGLNETPVERFTGMTLRAEDASSSSASSPRSAFAGSIAFHPRLTGWSERLVKRHSPSDRRHPSSGWLSHQCGFRFAMTWTVSCT